MGFAILAIIIGIIGAILYFVVLRKSSSSAPTTTPAAPTSTQTINPLDYLWQHLSTDTLTDRRIDFGGYQISDSLKYDDTHCVATWCYSPFGAYNPAIGDGGEEYLIDGDSVYITSTKDGSGPLQTFPTHDWLLFKWDADNSWKETLSGDGKLTRYSRQTVNFPVMGNIDTLVCEHYNGRTAAVSTAMERIFLGKGYGRLCWQAWRTDNLAADLTGRAPDFGWNTLAGWNLSDTRVCVNPMTTLPVVGNELWNPSK